MFDNWLRHYKQNSRSLYNIWYRSWWHSIPSINQQAYLNYGPVLVKYKDEKSNFEAHYLPALDTLYLCFCCCILNILYENALYEKKVAIFAVVIQVGLYALRM